MVDIVKLSAPENKVDIVLIPVYARPDYLRLCLEYLSRAEGSANKDIRIYVDRGKSLIREFYDVINSFRWPNMTVTFRGNHEYFGNSFNVLEAYKEAYQSDARFVYLVEEDVLVTPDFFRWHETIQNQEDLFCSIAYRCHRNSATRKDIDDPAAYLLSSCDYASIGVCWKRNKLASVVEHANTDYYKDLNGYLAKHFPNNKFAECFTEQDGMIMRLLGESNERLTAWPFVPRSFHVGVAGYNRTNGPRLSYNELKETIHDSEKIKMIDKDFGDIEVVPTEPVAKWDKLYCAQRIS